MFGRLSTWGHNLTEVVISYTVKIWEVLLPFGFEFPEHGVRYGNICAACINDCGVCLFLAYFLALLSSVKHSLSIKGPLFHGVGPVWPICLSLHLLKAWCSTDDLVSIESSKDSIGLLIHIWSGNTEAYNSIINDSRIFKLPYIAEVSLLCIRVNG